MGVRGLRGVVEVWLVQRSSTRGELHVHPPCLTMPSSLRAFLPPCPDLLSGRAPPRPAVHWPGAPGRWLLLRLDFCRCMAATCGRLPRPSHNCACSADQQRQQDNRNQSDAHGVASEKEVKHRAAPRPLRSGACPAVHQRRL